VQRQRQEKVSQVLASDHWQKLLAA